MNALGMAAYQAHQMTRSKPFVATSRNATIVAASHAAHSAPATSVVRAEYVSQGTYVAKHKVHRVCCHLLHLVRFEYADSV